MPAFGSNPITIAFAEVVLNKERIVSGDGSEEDPYVYEKIGFRLTDRIVSALDRFIGALSRFRLANSQLMDRWLFIYPFVGGVDWVHAMNLSDVAGGFTKFALTYTGTITHNQNGVTFTSGSSANTNCDCADIKTNPQAWNRRSYGIYVRTNSSGSERTMSASFVEPKNGYTYWQGIYPRYTDGIAYSDCCSASKTGVPTILNRCQVAVADSLGLYVDNQRGLTVSPFHYLFKKGVYIVGDDNTGTPGSEQGMGYGDGIVHAYMTLSGTRNISFCFSTKHTKTLQYTGLPGSNLEFYTFVQQLQVALLRAV